MRNTLAWPPAFASCRMGLGAVPSVGTDMNGRCTRTGTAWKLPPSAEVATGGPGVPAQNTTVGKWYSPEPPLADLPCHAVFPCCMLPLEGAAPPSKIPSPLTCTARSTIAPSCKYNRRRQLRAAMITGVGYVPACGDAVTAAVPPPLDPEFPEVPAKGEGDGAGLNWPRSHRPAAYTRLLSEMKRVCARPAAT